MFENNNSDAKLIASEYRELNGKKDYSGNKYPVVLLTNKNKFQYIFVDEIIKFFADGKNAIIYMGYAECLNCRHVIEILDDVSSDMNIDILYYLDVSQITGYEKLKLFDLLGEEFIYYDEYSGERYLAVPIVLFLANGKIVSYHNSTVPYHDSYKNLTSQQEQFLKDIYKYGINDIIADIN